MAERYMSTSVDQRVSRNGYAETFSTGLGTDPSPIAAEAGERVLLLFSGGIDSVLSWHSLQQSGYRVGILTVNYDGRPKGEVRSCDRLLAELGCQRLHRMTLGGWGHLPGVPPPGVLPELRAGFIPHRNLVFWSLAASIAVRFAKLRAKVGERSRGSSGRDSGVGGYGARRAVGVDTSTLAAAAGVEVVSLLTSSAACSPTRTTWPEAPQK